MMIKMVIILMVVTCVSSDCELELPEGFGPWVAMNLGPAATKIIIIIIIIRKIFIIIIIIIFKKSTWCEVL